MAKYGEERVQKTHQVVVDTCNQKCRDIRRKSKSSNHETTIDAKQSS